MTMILISKSKFKAKMLSYFREMERTGQEMIVTDRDRPVAKISPLTAKNTREALFADLRGKLRSKSDLLEPELDEWEDI